MLLGPIFQVEMVMLARRRRYFMLRVVYGILMLMILGASYQQARIYAEYSQAGISISAGQELATSFFNNFSWLQMFAILAVGPAMAVGTIASERERRTIEYLFATDLANYEIVLGKIIARLCLLGQFILVGMPILFVFRMMGGISTDLLLGTFLLAGSTAVLLTTFSVCVSVWSPRTRDATTRVYALLAAFLILPMLMHSIGQHWFSNLSFWDSLAVPILDILHMLNPINVLGKTFMMGGEVDLPLLFKSVAVQQLLSFLATLIAIFAVRRVHLREASSGVKSRSRFSSFQLPKWRRPLGNSPMIWKEMFSLSASSRLGTIGRALMMLFLGVIFVGLFSIFAFSLGNSQASNFVGFSFANYFSSLFVITILLGLVVLLLLATIAAGSITSEKERDCWLALLATPLTGKEILWGKFCGCLYSMRWPLGLLGFAWLLSIFLDPRAVLGALGTMFTVSCTAWFAVNLGLLYSLRSQTTMRAMGATLATLFFCGGGYLFCCCTVMMGGGGDEGMVLFMAPCIPFLLGLPIASLMGNVAGSSSEQIPILAAYLMGTLGYLIAGIAIFFHQVDCFDEITGRSYSKPDGLKDAT